MSKPILWEDFEPGATLGEASQVFDETLSRAWSGIFGDAPTAHAAQGAGIAVALMMRAYLAVVTPRPPGNVHARQRFTLEALPMPGETIHAVVRCLSKELRRDRRYVELEVLGTGEGARGIYQGILTLIWAA